MISPDSNAPCRAFLCFFPRLRLIVVRRAFGQGQRHAVMALEGFVVKEGDFWGDGLQPRSELASLMT